MFTTINKMQTKNPAFNRILLLLLREPLTSHTATSMAKSLNLTRQGIWTVLKKLSNEKMIVLDSIGEGKTGITIIRLKWLNPVTERTLLLLLTKESVKYQRWMANFAELENKVDFSLLYGSILSSPKEAHDIDILSIVSKKKEFLDIDNILHNIQKTQIKKIHAINFTPEEFEREFRKPNKVFMDALKTGVILYGQEAFIDFVKKWSTS